MSIDGRGVRLAIPGSESNATDRFYRRAVVSNWGIGALLRFTGGPLLQLVALQIFGVGVTFFVVLTAALGATSACQLLGLAAFYRYGAYAPLIACYRARTLALLLLAPAPFLLPYSRELSIALWALLVVALNALHAAGFSVCWPPIVRAGTDKERRGRVTSRLRAIQTVVVSVLSVAIAVLGPARFGPVEFAVLCLGFAAFSHVATRQVRWMAIHVPVEGGARQGVSVTRRVLEDWRYLTREANARRLLVVVIGFGVVGLPLQVFYLDSLLRFPRDVIFWFIAANTLVGIASMLLWGNAIDRRGGGFAARAGLLLILGGLLVQLWWLRSAGGGAATSAWIPALLLACLVVVNVGAQGLALIWFNEALRILPAAHTTAGVMLLGSSYEIAAAASAYAGGLALALGFQAGYPPYGWYLAAIAAVVMLAYAAVSRTRVLEAP